MGDILLVTRLKFILVVFEMVTLGEHTFNQGADPVVKIGFRNVATDTWVTVDNDTVTLQVLYYTACTSLNTTPPTTPATTPNTDCNRGRFFFFRDKR